MDYRVCVQRSIDHVEEHLREPLEIADLAVVAGFSPYHFCRVFQSQVGLSVMEYVRRRRMAHAAAQLVAGRRILDVAVEFGFDTHAGFTKAFRRTHGLAPEQYRRYGTGQIPAKADLLKLIEYHLLGGVVMQPRFVVRPTSKVVGYELQTTLDNNTHEIPAFWDRYFAENWAVTLHQELSPAAPADLGICFPTDPETGRFSYVIGVEVDSFDGIPEQFFRGEMPAATYAVFTTPPADRANYGFTEAIQGSWRYIWNEWFPASGYEYASGAVDFELYDQRCCGDTGLVMDIYVPVRKRQ